MYNSEQPILVSVSVRMLASGLVSVGLTDTDTTFTSKLMTVRSSNVERVEVVEAKKVPLES